MCFCLPALRPTQVQHLKSNSNMFIRTFILIAAAITGINAACDNGHPGYTHIVVHGDTCYGIATQGGITVARLVAANPGINCDFLRVGQRVCVPRNSLRLMSNC
ncbi:hypothetical protein IW262DRAFT_691928 [Armillaria fumosa]|nr:hypothetical protein IW262DRAFT_691928 [Armillaria fumosa]